MSNRALKLLAGATALTLAGAACGQVFVQSGLPISIEDTPTVVSTLTIAGGPATLTQMELVLRADHTNNSNLDMLLVRGTKYLHLSSDNGSSGDNLGNIRFRDGAFRSASIMPSTGNVIGDFRPEGFSISLATGATFSLAGLTRVNTFADLIAGEIADGDWTLVIDDDATNDVGSLLYWSLELNGASDATGPSNLPLPPAFTGDFTGTPNTLTFGTPESGTTNWSGPTGAQPGLTDGAGEDPLTSYANAPFFNEFPGAEVAYRYVHTGGAIAFRAVSSGGAPASLVVTDSTGTPAGALGVASETFTDTEILAFQNLPAGTYYVVLENTSNTGNGTDFTLDTGIPPSNDACETPGTITLGTPASFDTRFSSNAGFNADYCFGTAASPDIWYSFTPTQAGLVTFEACDADFEVSLSAFSACDGLPIRCALNGCPVTDRASLQVCVTPGVPVLIRVAGFLDVTGVGSLTASFDATTSTYSAPAGTPEPEPCRTELDDIDLVNGGCQDPAMPLFTSIAAGQTYIGNTTNSIGFSVLDADEYIFTLAADADVTVSGQTEFDCTIQLISDPQNCGLASPVGDPVVTTGPCRPDFSITQNLTAGTYSISITPGDFDNSCSDAIGNGYWVRLSVGSSCRADFNGMGGLSVQDIFDYLAAYFSADPRADFNGVGGLTVQDIFDFLAAFFTGCP